MKTRNIIMIMVGVLVCALGTAIGWDQIRQRDAEVRRLKRIAATEKARSESLETKRKPAAVVGRTNEILKDIEEMKEAAGEIDSLKARLTELQSRKPVGLEALTNQSIDLVDLVERTQRAEARMKAAGERLARKP